LVFVVFSMSATWVTGTPAEGRSPTETVRRFLSVLVSDSPATIADYQDLFGPHDENELILQLRFEGVKNPLTDTPAPDVVKGVNQRLLTPATNRSFFLCFLRRDLRRMQAGEWRVDEIRGVLPGGFRRVQARASAAVLTFEFAAGEHFIERVLDGDGAAISAERFMSRCQSGACCE
jgi:hypothetical protein